MVTTFLIFVLICAKPFSIFVRNHDKTFGKFVRRAYSDTIKVKKYEIDFLLVKKKKVCPVEVKSSGYSSHKSFDYFIKKNPIKIEDRYIIYTKDLKFEDGITYIPVYMAGLL